MNKKVSEIMDDLEYEWLEDIELEHDERINQISFEHIRERAMNGVEEEDKNIISINTHKKKKINSKRKFKRILIPLVAAISLMGITAVAINSNEGLREILGEALPFIQSEIQSIGETTTHKGIDFTAEAAAIENKAGIFYLSFEKEDESLFEEGITFRRIQPSIKRRGGMGWTTESALINNGKKLMAIIDLSGSKELYNQTIEFTAYDVGKWEEGIISPNINLEQVYKNTLTQQEESIPLIESFLPYTLDKVEFEGDTLELITSVASPNGECLLQHDNITLIDKRTGKEIEYDGGSGSWDVETQRDTKYHRFIGLNESDLAYLDIKLEYTYFNPLVSGEWKVAFQLDKNENVKEKKLFKQIRTQDINVTLHDVQISKLGVKIEGLRHKGSSYDLTGYIQMKDGTKIKLVDSGSWGSWNLIFGKQYKFGTNIDSIQIDAINNQKKTSRNQRRETLSNGIGESTISISTSKSTDDELSSPTIIDLENVESIVLEGVAIPIK